MNAQELSTLLNSNTISGIAFITGTLGVWLTIRQNIWCWPLALVSVGISILVFFQKKLYGDMCLNLFYFFAGIYGWIYWGRQTQKEFKVQPVKKNKIPLLILITLAQSVAYYYLLRYFRGNQALFDATLTAASLSATYMMTKKWTENWILWVMIDTAYIFLYGIQDMWWYSALYLVFATMAAYGYYQWKAQESSK